MHENRYFCDVANSFSDQFIYNKQTYLAVVVPQLKKDGMHYEVNIQGFPRFNMLWSALDRYDIIGDSMGVPYEVILAVSDIIQARVKRRR